jgi:hypothetical protein
MMTFSYIGDERAAAALTKQLSSLLDIHYVGEVMCLASEKLDLDLRKERIHDVVGDTLRPYRAGVMAKLPPAIAANMEIDDYIHAWGIDPAKRAKDRLPEENDARKFHAEAVVNAALRALPAKGAVDPDPDAVLLALQERVEGATDLDMTWQLLQMMAEHGYVYVVDSDRDSDANEHWAKWAKALLETAGTHPAIIGPKDGIVGKPGGGGTFYQYPDRKPRASVTQAQLEAAAREYVRWPILCHDDEYDVPEDGGPVMAPYAINMNSNIFSPASRVTVPVAFNRAAIGAAVTVAPDKYGGPDLTRKTAVDLFGPVPAPAWKASLYPVGFKVDGYFNGHIGTFEVVGGPDARGRYSLKEPARPDYAGNTYFVPAEEIAKMIKTGPAQMARHREMLAARDRETQAASATAADYADLDGFEKQFSDLQRGKVLAALNKTQGVNGVVATRKAHIRRLVGEGYTVASAKEGRRLIAPDGSFFAEADLTKTALDYAEYLNESTARTAPGQTDADKVAAIDALLPRRANEYPLETLHKARVIALTLSKLHDREAMRGALDQRIRKVEFEQRVAAHEQVSPHQARWDAERAETLRTTSKRAPEPGDIVVEFGPFVDEYYRLAGPPRPVGPSDPSPGSVGCTYPHIETRRDASREWRPQRVFSGKGLSKIRSEWNKAVHAAGKPTVAQLRAARDAKQSAKPQPERDATGHLIWFKTYAQWRDEVIAEGKANYPNASASDFEDQVKLYDSHSDTYMGALEKHIDEGGVLSPQVWDDVLRRFHKEQPGQALRWFLSMTRGSREFAYPPGYIVPWERKAYDERKAEQRAAKPLTGKKLDAEVERLFGLYGQDMQFSIHDLGKLHKATADAITAGQDGAEAMKAAVTQYRRTNGRR